MPPGFDLIPVSRVSRRLVIPSAEVNLQLSPFKRANDRDPSYYIAGKERAVLLDPKSPIPGSFDDTASRPLADNQTVALKTAPQSVLDISNIRLVSSDFKAQSSDGGTKCFSLHGGPSVLLPSSFWATWTVMSPLR